MVKIRIDYAKCVGTDKLCLELCPASVFRNKKPKPTVANEENCIQCRTCQVNCPSQAIDISA